MPLILNNQFSTAAFPHTRLRRTRMSSWVRELVAEHRLHASDLVWPVFIQEGQNTHTPVPSMPGVFRLTLDLLVEQAKAASALGIQAIALFPIVGSALKTAHGGEALNPDNLVCRAIREIKRAVPRIGIISDVALDPYTSHGHDGIIENGNVANDATVEMLCKQALVQAQAGCDIVAPSDMMDGRIGAVRSVLEQNGFSNTLILSYSAKYASGLYGPFRDAVDSRKALGNADKRGYQMDSANGDEALREMELDVAEGADILMVKPGIAYLDIVYRAAQRFPLPIFAYQVSGEYAMIHAAGANGWINADAVMQESLLAFKRAGARAIFTYAAPDIARALQS